ncbi:MAG: acyl-CoA dehydrogenase family protein [Acidimicrobiales bacterium]
MAPTLFTSELVDTSDHHQELRRSVSGVAGSFGRKYFQDVVKRDAKPTELWAALAEAGFLGVHIPVEDGGGGGGLADYNIVIEETAAQGCPILSLVIGSITAPIIARHGSPDLRKRWLPGIADGSLRMSFAITEPDAGTNTHRITTTAKPNGDGWLLNGTKYYTSGVDEADSILVVARSGEPDAGGRHRLSLFVVAADAAGITTQDIPCAVQAAEKQFTVFFDDVELGPDALIGTEGNGLRQVFAGLNPERVSAAAINNGIARFGLETAAAYAQDRVVWNEPIGAHQGVAHPLAAAYIGVQQARLMTARAAELFDQGSEDAGEVANMAKFAAADSSLVALDQSIQTLGGNGLALEYGLADLWFVARLHKTAPVSREMILNFVAQHSLGLPKSY